MEIFTGSHGVVECLILEGEFPEQHAHGVVPLQQWVGLNVPNCTGQPLREEKFIMY